VARDVRRDRPPLRAPLSGTNESSRLVGDVRDGLFCFATTVFGSFATILFNSGRALPAFVTLGRLDRSGAACRHSRPDRMSKEANAILTLLADEVEHNDLISPFRGVSRMSYQMLASLSE
jgi:hypothetical protein